MVYDINLDYFFLAPPFIDINLNCSVNAKPYPTPPERRQKSHSNAFDYWIHKGILSMEVTQVQMTEMADFLKSLRKSKGLTQVELADMLNVSNKTVSKWENALGIPEMSTLLLLSEIYEVSVDDILRGSRKMPKNEDKTNDRFRYLLHKSKHQYINHLILFIGFFILGILAFSVTDTLTESSGVALTVTMAFVLISIGLQTMNVFRIRYQLIELQDSNDRDSISKMVLNSSFLNLFAVMWLSYFALIRNLHWLKDEPLDAMMFSSVIPAFAFAFVQTLIIYVLVRIIVKSQFDARLLNIQKIFIGALIAVIVIPFVTLQIRPARDVAIAVDWGGGIQSTYQIDHQEDQYYQLRLLWVIDQAIKEGTAPNDVYDIVMIPDSLTSNVPAVHYHFTYPTDYELYIELTYFEDDLVSRGYSHFTVSDDSISAYWFQNSDIHLSFEMYGYLTGVLLSIWLTAGIGIIIYQV